MNQYSICFFLSEMNGKQFELFHDILIFWVPVNISVINDTFVLSFFSPFLPDHPCIYKAFSFSTYLTVTKQNDKILSHIRPSKQQSVSAPPIPAALYHVLVFPAETRLRVPLFFTMATSYPNGNEGVLHSVTRINLSGVQRGGQTRISV